MKSQLIAVEEPTFNGAVARANKAIEAARMEGQNVLSTQLEIVQATTGSASVIPSQTRYCILVTVQGTS